MTTRLFPRRALAVGLALLCATVVALPAFARKTEEERAAHHAKRQAKMEAVIKERLAPRLELDDDQTERLLETLRQVGDQRRAARQNVHAESKKLKALLDEGANDGQLSEQMARLRAAREAMPPKGALLDDTARFLTVEQQAKLTLMLPKMMKRARHKPRGERGHRFRGVEEGPPGFEGAESDF
jgi:phage gp16-like protein